MNKTFKEFFIEKTILGLIEFLDIGGVGKVPAKLDTGNGAYNVIHGEDVQIQGSQVFFRTVNGKTLVKPLRDTILINVGSGNTEERPVVEFDVRVGPKEFNNILFSIGNRRDNIFKILVSKDFIEKNLDALIDVSQENIADKDIQVDDNI